MAYTNYMISATSGSGTLVDLSLLSTPVPYPKGLFVPYSKLLDLGSGLQRGGGWTTVTWHWEIISPTQRDMMKTFCPGQSSSVWIVTRVNDQDVFQYFSAFMIWPQNEQRDFLRRSSFDILFRGLVPTT